MNTQIAHDPKPSSKTIFQLVKIIAANARPSALRHNSFIVNDIPQELIIIADENILATVLSRLIYSLVNDAEDSCIRVTAREYDDIVFVQMKGAHGIDNATIENELQQAQAYAKKMNGNIGLSREDGKVTGIVFSFPNMHFNKNHHSPGSQNITEPISG
jgi:hypothetical protein